MKNSSEFPKTINNSVATRSQQKTLSSIDPCAREFNFELWANLVRERMRTVLHRAS